MESIYIFRYSDNSFLFDIVTVISPKVILTTLILEQTFRSKSYILDTLNQIIPTLRDEEK